MQKSPIGGHVSASLNLERVLDYARPTADRRSEFLQAASSVSIQRPTEGLTQAHIRQTHAVGAERLARRVALTRLRTSR